jgi:hypothetical protein
MVAAVSFVLDPPMLVASGAAIEGLGVDEATARRLGAATVGLYVGVSLALYANAPGLRAIWGPFGARSGREFMLTSGLARVDERAMTPRRHAAALSLFAAYPLWLGLGRAAVRRRRSARSPAA